MDIELLEQEITDAVLDSAEAVDAFRIRFLSRKQGQITALMKQIPQIAPEDRKAYGQRVNALKGRVEERLDQAQAALAAPKDTAPTDIDLTLPGRTPLPGSLHPLTETRMAIERVFRDFGFGVEEGPELEDDWHNFTALNFPPDHPARDMQDTFFIEQQEGSHESVLLRTHTSPAQIRIMKATQPPIRVVVPGRVYRNEAITYKSFCLFHQVEGLYVDEGVSLADLKQVLYAFARAMFGADVQIRFRPSFFPFTEPSAEMDIWNPEKGTWMEILGCGMVDPNVFDAVGIDSERYTGYAFGMGIERIAMLRHGIADIRILYENDARFLGQF